MIETPAASKMLRFNKHLDSAQEYVPEWLGLVRSKYLRLDRNESTAPVPEHVVRALNTHAAGHGVHTYPDAERLAGPLATYCGVSPECILTTNGSDQAIALSLRDSILSTQGNTRVARRGQLLHRLRQAHRDATGPDPNSRSIIGATGQFDPR